MSKYSEDSRTSKSNQIHRRSQSLPLREHKTKIPMINQKPLPIHYQYYQGKDLFGLKETQCPQKLEFWGCLVPKENDYVVKKKLEQACSMQLGRRKDRVSMPHTKLSSQIVLERYLDRKEAQQKKQIFVGVPAQRSMKPKFSDDDAISIRKPNTAMQRVSPSKWINTCLTTDMTEGESKWMIVQKHKNDEGWALTKIIDQMQNGTQNKFNELEKVQSRIRKIRNRQVYLKL